jgi:rubrerythrin
LQQLTDMEQFHIGEQLKAEAFAVSKYTNYARQSTDPHLQQIYGRMAERHRGHYETLFRYAQNFAPQRQF